MRAPALILLATLAPCARAALPDAVLEACLRPTLTEEAFGLSWHATTRQDWERAPLRVTEAEGRVTAEADGAEHPNGWVKTRLTLSQPPLTDANPRPTQTFTVTATPTGVTPSTTLRFELLKDAPLPPCKPQAWGGRIALVADAGDWYVIADNPKAQLIRAEGDPVRWTLRETRTVDARTPASAAILVGEGPLPPPPKAE